MQKRGSSEHLDLDMQNNEEDIIVVAESNIVSNKELFMENEEEEDLNNSLDAQEESDTEEIVVANIDDYEPEQLATQTRPRRANAGADVERLQIEFIGKEYSVQREFHFVINGETRK